MSSIAKKLMMTAAGGEALAIEDVFSTYLYIGNGSTQTITNYIDLAGEGGMVWFKNRQNTADHFIHDTARDRTKSLKTNLTGAESNSVPTSITSFNSDGFTLGSSGNLNISIATINQFVSWTFRKAPRFFDVVTYTGNGASQTIPHNLGVEPGCIIVKNTGATANWAVYHRGTGAFAFNARMQLNLTDAVATSATAWNGTAPTDTEFSVGNFFNTNASGNTYVAYLFAHDPLGPSGDGSDGLIDCGSYTGNGANPGPVVNIGWEPQWLLVKRSNSTGDWVLLDVFRGMPDGMEDANLAANLSNAEFLTDAAHVTATGFQIAPFGHSLNTNQGNYTYIAIRRGPMRAPESGNQVHKSVARTGTGGAASIDSIGFNPDMLLSRSRTSTSQGHYVLDRLRGITGRNKLLQIYSDSGEFNDVEATPGVDIPRKDGSLQLGGDFQSYINTSGQPFITHMFRRAPEFFDVVAYKGKDTLGAAIPHNLGVAPELVIIKSRNGPAARKWMVALPLVGPDGRQQSLSLNLSSGLINERMFPSGGLLPDENNFYLASENSVNTSSDNYIAYLFATLAGVSKVGSYTGNGTSQTINCGFTTGARFILIKRTDSTGDWYVWDTARGIIAGNDPHLSLNTTAAEVTTDDSIDPASSGFIVNQVAATDVNVNAASYIFYAVA